jgi:hypothetical protein
MEDRIPLGMTDDRAQHREDRGLVSALLATCHRPSELELSMSTISQHLITHTSSLIICCSMNALLLVLCVRHHAWYHLSLSSICLMCYIGVAALNEELLTKEVDDIP